MASERVCKVVQCKSTSRSPVPLHRQKKTPTQNRKFPMKRKPYPSDLTDAEWSILEPLIPFAKFGGHPRTTNMREVVDAILYLVRGGCAWRALPHDFPGYGRRCGRISATGD